MAVVDPVPDLDHLPHPIIDSDLDHGHVHRLDPDHPHPAAVPETQQGSTSKAAAVAAAVVVEDAAVVVATDSAVVKDN